MRIWPGRPYPLGAHWDGQGVNVALFSECATGVELRIPDQGPHEVRIRQRGICRRVDEIRGGQQRRAVEANRRGPIGCTIDIEEQAGRIRA